MTASFRPPRVPTLRPRSLSSAPPGAPIKDRATRVLLVDDEPNVRRSLARVLMSVGFEVMTAEDGQAAISLLEAGTVDVMLVDMLMPRMGGMDLLNRVKATHPEVEVIMMTAYANVDDAVAAVKNGAYDFLTKPFPSNDVVAMTISKAAERKQLLDRMDLLEQRLEQQENFGELIGNTAGMREVYRLALGVAPTSATVLVLGESGTGKELIARAIHQHSGRTGPFLAVNCSAIPNDLVESELFGHVRGAFTGAVNARVGLFEAADKGTVFLDEVGDLPLQSQVKLLRVLQEGEIRRVGSNDPVTVDARVIAATNADLKTQISIGKFREDLYYRLHVIAIHVPPLRRRRDDIPLLSYHFLRKYARRMSRDVGRIGVEAMRILREQKWPGNVRELEHAIEHAVVMAKSDTIVPGDLPSYKEVPPPVAYEDEDSVPAPDSETVLTGFGRLTDLPYASAKKQALDMFEQAYLEAVLRRTGGNVSEAARQAGLDRSNFRRVLKKADFRKKTSSR
jgi:two-component system response regulator HydG